MIPSERSASFQTLKPRCVQTIQAIGLFRKTRTDGTRIVISLTELNECLQALGTSGLDPQLADYVFFPLAQVFRESTKLPNRAIELALCCVSRLILFGWNSNASSTLCKELLVLLSFLISRGEVDRPQTAAFTSEVKLQAIECIESMLFSCREAVNRLFGDGTDEATVLMGTALSCVLNTIKSSPEVQVQVAATEAMTALCCCLEGTSKLQDFLPGIVSTLAQVIQPNVQPRRSYKALTAALGSLRTILQAIVFTMSPMPGEIERMPSRVNTSQQWLNANTTPLHLALTMAIKARHHERAEVRHALHALCKSVLVAPQQPLKESANLMIETVIILCSHESCNDEAGIYQDTLDLLSSQGILIEELKALIHTWILQLPRLSEGTSEDRLHDQLELISYACNICQALRVDISSLQQIFLGCFLDSTDKLLQAAKSSPLKSMRSQELQSSEVLDQSNSNGSSNDFNTSTLASWSTGLSHLQAFVDEIAWLDIGFRSLKDLTTSIATSRGNHLIASLWLIARISVVRSLTKPLEPILVGALETAYSESVDILNSDLHGHNDWRLEALALEVVSIYARTRGTEIEADLVDVLLPVIECVGSSRPETQEAAIACLNVLASACDAATPGNLVMQNADYLINAVALKLNAFDITYQTPRVLVMVINLCGVEIVPYLDDILESIISALAAHHGYPLLVESFFAVLDAIVRQVGVPVSSNRSASRTNGRHSESNVHVCTVQDVIHRTRSNSVLGEGGDALFATRPRRNGNADSDEESNLIVPAEERPSAKATAMALTIIRLAQHYLTGELPSTRLSLLKLIKTGCNAVSDNEDEFLPLLNDIWPVVYNRISDSDINVRIMAIETVSSFFEKSGDFLSSRVQNEWLDILVLARRSQSQSKAQEQRSRYRSEFTEARRTWKAFVRLFVALITHLRTTGEMEDELLELLGPYADKNSDIELALQAMNSDALWLFRSQCDQKHNVNVAVKTPQMHGFIFKSFDTSN